LTAQEQTCGNLNRASSALEVQPGLAQKANAIGHILKPLVVFEAQNICVRSSTIQVEFEIERSSAATLSAVASASIASDRSRSDRDGEMR
jgi:hypothetical protein